MALTLIAIDPETDSDHCPAVLDAGNHSGGAWWVRCHRSAS